MTIDRKIEAGLAVMSFPFMAIGLAFNSEILMFAGVASVVSIGMFEGIKLILRHSKFINPTQPDQ